MRVQFLVTCLGTMVAACTGTIRERHDLGDTGIGGYRRHQSKSSEVPWRLNPGIDRALEFCVHALSARRLYEPP